ncbi:MAG: hypothetical protein R2909_06925 [Gemmatimonadales bacterium]
MVVGRPGSPTAAWYRVTTAGGTEHRSSIPRSGPASRSSIRPGWPPRSRERSTLTLAAERGCRSPVELCRPTVSLTTAWPAARGPRPRRVHLPDQPAPPPNSSVSPDGKWAAHIRDYDLWATELPRARSGRTDGIEDFGYATTNAGWSIGSSPVLTWSPD